VVTIVIIALNVLVFVAMAAGGVSPVEPTTQDLLKWGASYGPYELSTEWWRVFTAMFVHIGFVHILLNMYCLYSLGPLAERIFGPWKFAALYLLSGLGGNVASVALHPTIVAAGASGAIFGVAGALLPVLHFRQLPAIVSQRGGRGRLGIGGFIVYNLIYGFANAGIDNAAHIGGLVTGFAVGYAAPVVGSPAHRHLVLRTRGVLIALTLFLVAAFVLVREWRPSHGADMHLLRGGVYLHEGKNAEAITEFELALRDDSTNPVALENLGVAYLRSNRPADALTPLERAQSLNRDDATANYNLGLANVALNKYETAVFYLSQSLRIRPDYPMALVQRGYAYQQLGKADSARADYQGVLSQPGGAVSEETRAEVRRLLAALPRR
jgi:membrane associated rhomboid family serine protease/Tfp pilus assembly protein PilF